MLTFAGLLSIIFLLGPLIQAEIKYKTDSILGVKKNLSHSNTLGDLRSAKENQIIPVSTEFGIVIEKINANAKIIPNVDASNERAYVQALTEGVAEALGSTPPGQVGNLYLFSHSTDAPWNIIRFNAIFYLLKELEKGDRVIIFYQHKRFDYIVFDKIIASPFDVSYLTKKYQEPILTLQTCDPPGTLLNRLIVRARLVNT